MWSTTNGYHGNTKLSMDEDFEEVKIPVPWGHIAGKWWGSRNTQPAIALHGWQDNAGTFDTLAPLLKKEGISVLCIDLPGHGFSSHYPQGQYYYIFWDGLHFLRRIVQYFKWDKITLIGHSLGGGIAFLYAAVYPNEVKKYISIDIAAPTVREPQKIINLLGDSIDRFLKYEKMTRDRQPCYDYTEMIDIVVDAYKGSVTRKSCEILMKRGMKANTDSTYLFSRDARLKSASLGFMTLDQVLEFASHITCEVLNIRAEPGMPFDKPEYYDAVVDKIKESAKKAEVRLVPGTHHLHLNNPERVAPIIVDFIKS